MQMYKQFRGSHARLCQPVSKVMWPPGRLNEESYDLEMTNEFGMDQEIIRRLVERIIKLEVDQETLKRRVDEPLVGNDIFGPDEDGSSNRIMLWNRILRLEEGQQVVQKHVQELFANVMDFELQSRGEPCYLHDQSNVIGRERKSKQRWLYGLRGSLNRSTHSGLKYLTEFGPSSLRVFWAVALMAVLMVCSVSVYFCYCHWSSSTSSFTYTQTQVPLGSIPFPAVTICPERNIGGGFPLDTLLKHCTEWACTRDDFDMFSAASFLCPSLTQTMPSQAWSKYYNTTSPKFMQQIMPTCKEDILSYHWAEHATEVNCSKSFQTLYIDDRVCFTYNMLPASYIFKDGVSSEPVMTDPTDLRVRPGWTPHTLARPEPTDKSLPVHRDWPGEDFRLTVNLERKPFNQSNCQDPFRTFQVAVHHPADIPSRTTHQYFRLPLNHSLYIAVTPRLETSPRDCLDPREGASGMFRHYSPSKCHLECRVKCSVNMCGCVPLYLPRKDNATKWCGLHRRYCPDTLVPELLRGAISWDSVARYFRMWIREDLKEEIDSHHYRYPGKEGLTDRVLSGLRPDCSCECPPACHTLTYDVYTQAVIVSKGADDRSWKNRSEINIYYKEGMEAVTATEKRVTNYVIDFLAHVGGLVALLTGLSVLSLVEVLYLAGSALLRRQDSGYVSRQTSCLRHKQEWDKTVQTDSIFITEGHLNVGF